MKKPLIKERVALASYSTFGIGGAARYFAIVCDETELQEALTFARDKAVPYLPVGKGSNTLFDDRGFAGLVILNKMQHCHRERELVHAGSGLSVAWLGRKMARDGFSGLEFAAGIPGSVGGAVYMNAGANGREIQNTLESVVFVHSGGEIETFSREALDFAYRSSPFQSMEGVIAGASFRLAPSPQASAYQKSIIAARIATQPYKAKSAGCVFRNPPQHSAGRLIDEAGLKGASIGGAEVSTVHANFIVNKNAATADDVEALIDYVQRVVFEKTGITLQKEVRKIPYVF